MLAKVSPLASPLVLQRFAMPEHRGNRSDDRCTLGRRFPAALKPKFGASPEVAKLAEKFVMVNVEDDEEPEGAEYSPDGGYIPRILYIKNGEVQKDVYNTGGSDKYKCVSCPLPPRLSACPGKTRTRALHTCTLDHTQIHGQMSHDNGRERALGHAMQVFAEMHHEALQAATVASDNCAFVAAQVLLLERGCRRGGHGERRQSV